ncbi:MAG TPA: DoxX family protein [Chryseolinea sp.]|nr:DoxX family protein [Chryseolinea sp.]
MLYRLLQTNADYIYFFLRVVAGAIIFPHGMQKLLGWFDDLGGGVGTKEVIIRMKAKKIPVTIAWLVIVGQSFGSMALILGCFGRFAAGANFIIFTGALIAHAHDGWAMNWSGKKKGEGIEYFVLLLSILAVIVFKGSGALSIDRWILSKL